MYDGEFCSEQLANGSDFLILRFGFVLSVVFVHCFFGESVVK